MYPNGLNYLLCFFIQLFHHLSCFSLTLRRVCTLCGRSYTSCKFMICIFYNPSLPFFILAIMFTTAVLFYMVGLDSPIVQEVCGGSSVFHTGDCHIGWSYLLLILCSAVCFLLPVLSHYIDYSHLCANPTKKRSPREYQV